MNKNQAERIVEKQLHLSDKACSVMPELTTEFEKCFAVCYQSDEYIATRECGFQLVGHGPVLVDKITSRVFETGSAQSTGYYVSVFEQCGDPLATLSHRVKIKKAQKDEYVVMGIKAVKDIVGCGLYNAKTTIDSVVDGRAQIIDCKDVEEAELLTKVLIDCGFVSHHLWTNQ